MTAMHAEPDGEHWDGRFEFYLNPPEDEPDTEQSPCAALTAQWAQTLGVKHHREIGLRVGRNQETAVALHPLPPQA